MRDFTPVADAELGYERSRAPFPAGEGLLLDESYRLAHLPLVAPSHARVIARAPGKPYEMGRHPEVFSLVVPVDADALEASQAFRDLVADIRRQRFAGKIAWDVAERRRSKLHATLCGGMAPDLAEPECARLRAALPLAVELRGLFAGNINAGRLYLKLYPEARGGRNAIRDLQAGVGRRETDLYVVGLFNLIDDLDADEAAELAALIDRWWDRPLLRFEARELWLLGAKDDLVLDGRVVERIRPA